MKKFPERVEFLRNSCLLAAERQLLVGKAQERTVVRVDQGDGLFYNIDLDSTASVFGKLF